MAIPNSMTTDNDRHDNADGTKHTMHVELREVADLRG